MEQVKFEGDVWNVLGKGARRDGQIYLHLASTTKFNQQKNGKNPLQICDWFSENILEV